MATWAHTQSSLMTEMWICRSNHLIAASLPALVARTSQFSAYPSEDCNHNRDSESSQSNDPRLQSLSALLRPMFSDFLCNDARKNTTHVVNLLIFLCKQEFVFHRCVIPMMLHLEKCTYSGLLTKVRRELIFLCSFCMMVLWIDSNHAC